MKTIKTILCIVATMALLSIGAGIFLTGHVIDTVATELNATPAPATVVAADEEAVLSDRIIIVTPIEGAVVNEYSHVPEGIEIGCVNITVTNTSAEDILISSTDFKLYKNNVLCEDYIYGEKWFLSDTISGGRMFNGVLYYQIPVGTGNSILELEYSYDYKGSKVIFKVN